ncbi:MAG: RNA polymerase sigma-70 factor [Tannerella sp.]|nr:RNA polymerase sigma-70 factor [Tannerella sp.]
MFRKDREGRDFSYIFELYRKPYVQFAYSYIRDMDDAEDIYMDVILHFWENRDHISTDVHIPSYLLTAVKNRSLNYLRQQQTRSGIHERMFDHGMRELNFRISTLEDCEPVELFSEEIKLIINDTLARMPEQTRQIFFMSRYGNNTNKEIAEKLNLNIKTVEYHISKVLRILRVNLKDYFPLILSSLIPNMKHFF